MNMVEKKILVLAPHTDDGELGCGGTIAKLIEQGNDLYYACFSVCEQSVPGGLPKDILETEVKAATGTLGIPKDHLLLYRYPVRKFCDFRQDILEDLIVLKKMILPDIVIVPGGNDIHQDHQVIYAEGLRAFKQTSIMCYEMVWNNLSVRTTLFVKLDKNHLEAKINALNQYKSQMNVRNYFNADFIESMAKVRGVQVDSNYAEAFDVIRWLL